MPSPGEKCEVLRTVRTRSSGSQYSAPTIAIAAACLPARLIELELASLTPCARACLFACLLRRLESSVLPVAGLCLAKRRLLGDFK